MKDILSILIQKSVMVLLVIFGFVYEIQGAYNLFAFLLSVLFVIVVLFVLSFMFIPEITESVAKSSPPLRKTWKRTINYLVDIPMMVFLVWNGSLILGFIMLAIMLLIEMYFSVLENVRAKLAKDPE